MHDGSTFRRQITKRRSAITLHLGTRRIRQRNEDFADAHLQKLTLEFVCRRINFCHLIVETPPTAQGQDSNTRRHLALYVHRYFENKFLDRLYSPSLDNRQLVLF